MKLFKVRMFIAKTNKIHFFLLITSENFIKKTNKGKTMLKCKKKKLKKFKFF